jgi:DNA-binding response OmpR family regulator
MRVLVAEDSLIYQKLLMDCLGDWGFEPIPVKDGGQACDLLQTADAPRLALLDWVLPGMDGAELCRRLRRFQSRPYVYAIPFDREEQQG